MSEIKVNGKTVFYEATGEGDPVILLHGWLCTHKTVKIIADHLSKNFKVYNVDIVGFGNSELPDEPMNSDNYGDWLKKLIKALDVKNPILIGHSHGGRTILNYCYRKVTNASGTTLSYGTGVCPITYKLYLKNYSQSACKKGNAPYDKWLVQYATCKSSHIEVTANVEVDIAHSSYGTGAWTPVKSSGSSGPEVSNNGQCYCCGNSQGCTYKWSENGSSPGSNCGKVSKTKDQCTGTATNAITCNVSNCSKCSSNNYCSICKGDYTPSNGACVCKNIEGCIKYNSSCKCAKCDESEYTLSNGTCKAKSSGGSSGSTQEGTCECYKYEAVCTRVYVVNKCSNCNGTCTYDYELAHYECSETKKHYGLKDNTTCSKLEGINWGGTVKEVKQSYKCGNLTTCTKVCNSHGMYVKSGKCGSGGNGGR